MPENFGVDLGQIFENAKKSLTKEVESQLQGQVRGALMDEINLRGKVTRVEKDLDQAKALLTEAVARRSRLMQGDLSALVPFELTGVKSNDKQQETK